MPRRPSRPCTWRGYPPCQWKYQHRRDGRIIWASGLGEMDVPVEDAPAVKASQLWTPNALADEGESSMLGVYFRGATPPTAFFLRLYNDTPVDTDTLATLTGEVTGTGYAAIELSRDTTDWPILALDSGDYQVTSDDFVFTGGPGGWTAATHLVMATVASGTVGLLVTYNALGATRTLIENDALTVSVAVKLG